MFGLLACNDIVSVENVLIRILIDESLVVFDQSSNCAVRLGLGLFAQLPEYRFEAANVVLRFRSMLGKYRLYLLV